MLTITHLTKAYPGRNGRPTSKALNGVTFSVREGDFFTLLGPSGCGKTTTLQSIAGLETPDTGQIHMAGQLVFDGAAGLVVPANKRELGMVFQSYAIWPHMTVFDNVAFPLQHGPRRCGAAELRKRVMEALELVHLGHLAERPAPMLSGGQQQRVALARALVHRPRLLLLDEPLSNLDAKLRDTMRTEIRNLVKSIGTTTIFVTHDQVEAVGMSDQIVLMQAGQIVQQGSPHEIYQRPTSLFAADFMGRANLVPGRVTQPGTGGGPLLAETAMGPLAAMGAAGFATGERVVLVLRPQALRLLAPGESAPNAFVARIRQMTFLGDVVETEAEVGGQTLLLMLNPYERHALGDEIHLAIDPAHCVAVPAEAAPDAPAPTAGARA